VEDDEGGAGARNVTGTGWSHTKSSFTRWQPGDGGGIARVVAVRARARAGNEKGAMVLLVWW
jgi:hypothetical protein